MTDRIIDGFAYVRPFIGWGCFVVGVVMFFVTLFGLAAFGEGWLVRLASCAGWLVLASEGFDLIAEEAEDG